MQRIVVNLDASSISKDLFVHFVGDHDGACLIKQDRSLPWSGQLYIIASRIILGCS